MSDSSTDLSPDFSLDSFVRTTKKSGLVDEARIQSVLDDLPNDMTGDVAAVARRFVEQGLVTDWQATKLLRGKHKGFSLGKYRLLRLLGKGGMSSVYLAEHTLMRRRCALKVLPIGQVDNTSWLARFHREAQAIAALDHPNIVRAYDVDHEQDGERNIHFLVMEFVDGRSLQEIVSEDGPLSLDVAADYIRQAALGLEHAHRAGLVHRDVKPGNLLVDQQGVVKVLDLGLARFAEVVEENPLTVTHDERVLGTADYLSPEQAIDSHTVDSRADVYSLGCSIYFALTGRPPFKDGSLAQRLMAHQMKDAPPIAEFRPEIAETERGRKLAEIIRQMMVRDREKRYQTMAEVAEALEKWLRPKAKAPLAAPVVARPVAVPVARPVVAPPAAPVAQPAAPVAQPVTPPVAAPPAAPVAKAAPVAAAVPSAASAPPAAAPVSPPVVPAASAAPPTDDVLPVVATAPDSDAGGFDSSLIPQPADAPEDYPSILGGAPSQASSAAQTDAAADLEQTETFLPQPGAATGDHPMFPGFGDNAAAPVGGFAGLPGTDEDSEADDYLEPLPLDDGPEELDGTIVTAPGGSSFPSIVPPETSSVPANPANAAPAATTPAAPAVPVTAEPVSPAVPPFAPQVPVAAPADFTPQASPVAPAVPEFPSFGASPEAPTPGFAPAAPAGFDQPAVQPPAFGQPSFEQPSFGQPATDTPGFGQPAFDQPAFGQTSFEQPSFEQPAFGQPAFGQPAGGGFPAAAPGQPQPATAPPAATARKKQSSPVPLIAGVLGLLIIVGGAWFLMSGGDSKSPNKKSTTSAGTSSKGTSKSKGGAGTKSSSTASASSGALKPILTVGPGQEYKTIAAALAYVKANKSRYPDTTRRTVVRIDVAGGETFSEGIEIDNSGKGYPAGILIKSSNEIPVTLKPSGSGPAIRLVSIENLQIDNVVVDASGMNVGIELEGFLNRSKLSNIAVTGFRKTGILGKGLAGVQRDEVVLDHIDLRPADGSAVGVHLTSGKASTGRIQLQDCRLFGPQTTGVLLDDGAIGLDIRRTIIDQAGMGLSGAGGPKEWRDVRIVNCTFHQISQAAIHFSDMPVTGSSGMEFRRNLFAGLKGPELKVDNGYDDKAFDPFLSTQLGSVDLNWSDRSQAAKPESGERELIAREERRLPNIQFFSTDRNSDDFLTPQRGTPYGSHGVGRGDDGDPYIGARPQPN